VAAAFYKENKEKDEKIAEMKVNSSGRLKKVSSANTSNQNHINYCFLDCTLQI